MPIPPEHFPIPHESALRLGLETRVERDQRGDVKAWEYVSASLGDHPGLSYYRYVPRKPGGKPFSDDYATKYVQALTRKYGPSGVWNDACEAQANRLAATVKGLEALGQPTKTLERRTATRLLVGMGYKNALEVGLTFHHPGGFPYLPGTSVKGLCRAWAEMLASDEQTEGQKQAVARIERIFGSKTKQPDDLGGDMRAGSVCFLDALPTRFPRLDADLLNPHYSAYYMDEAGETAPSDWLSPIPVAFLAIAAGETFHFHLVGRTAEAGEDVTQAASWLTAALTDLGAGGKTSAGYGYFEPDSDEETIPPVPPVAAAETGIEKARGPSPHSGFADVPTKLERISMNTPNIPAQVVRVEAPVVFVRLHVEGYTDPMPVQARNLANDFSPGDWVTVKPATKDKKKRVNGVSGIRRMR
ncbi:MAG: type III-B CRISPR module RAMP protein Cmr6 [Bacteroidota bacterium]